MNTEDEKYVVKQLGSLNKAVSKLRKEYIANDDNASVDALHDALAMLLNEPDRLDLTNAKVAMKKTVKLNEDKTHGMLLKETMTIYETYGELYRIDPANILAYYSEDIPEPGLLRLIKDKYDKSLSATKNNEITLISNNDADESDDEVRDINDENDENTTRPVVNQYSPKNNIDVSTGYTSPESVAIQQKQNKAIDVVRGSLFRKPMSNNTIDKRGWPERTKTEEKKDSGTSSRFHDKETDIDSLIDRLNDIDIESDKGDKEMIQLIEKLEDEEKKGNLSKQQRARLNDIVSNITED
jgi:hypothetical protein